MIIWVVVTSRTITFLASAIYSKMSVENNPGLLGFCLLRFAVATLVRDFGKYCQDQISLIGSGVKYPARIGPLKMHIR